MAARDTLALIVLAITYAFFFLIGIMPILAKLVMRTTYDRRISSEYRRAAAQIEAEAAMAEAEAAMRAEIAKAELLGLEALLRQTGSDPVIELAKLRMEMEKDKAEVSAPFAPVSAMVDAFHRTQAQADDTPSGMPADPSSSIISRPSARRSYRQWHVPQSRGRGETAICDHAVRLPPATPFFTTGFATERGVMARDWEYLWGCEMAEI